MVKVIASSLRKGNVVEQDGKLHVVLTAENVHPGKGNSVTNVNMRRISDGVKVIGRWRTIEMVEKADVEGLGNARAHRIPLRRGARVPTTEVCGNVRGPISSSGARYSSRPEACWARPVSARPSS